MTQDNTPPRDESATEPGNPATETGKQVPPAPNVPPRPDVPPPPPFTPAVGPGSPDQPEYAEQPGYAEQPPPQADPVKRQRLVIGGIVVGVLVLIGVVIWVLLNLLGTRPEATVASPTPSATLGPLPRDTDARDFQIGDCFADFDPNASKARAVACDTEHTAQLGAAFTYPTEDSFPGTNALRDKGREVCKGIKLNDAANEYTNLLQQNVYPSPSSWDRGDRRVDCFIVVSPGSTIKEDLLKK
jgi:hypothetical protein